MKFRKFYEMAYHKYLNKENMNDYILRVLVMKAQGINGGMSNFFLCEDEELKDEQLLLNYIERVIEGEPYQYVVNECEFLGSKYYVDENVLIPRLETEELVITLNKTIKEFFPCDNIKILDVGTGSGCIALSLKKEVKNAHVFAIDISKNALEVAKKNAEIMGLEVTFLNGDMLTPLIEQQEKVDVLVSNPPYIQNVEDVDKSVLNYEPHLALFAPNGIDFYKKILMDAKKVLNERAVLAFEFNYDQKDKINDLILEYFNNAKCSFYKDFNDMWRYVIVRIN